MQYMEKMVLEEAVLNIGKRVRKVSNRPFKSRHKINTIKGVVNHPILFIPAYSFEEDKSIVECRRCIIMEKIVKEVKFELTREEIESVLPIEIKLSVVSVEEPDAGVTYTITYPKDTREDESD